jgi:prepilin-type N-terminal cleavage/methylation domain-containing protein
MKSPACRPLPPLKGFTLIELLVVISVMAILAGLLFTAMRSARIQGQLGTAKVELAELSTLIDSYKDATGFYPPDNSANPGLNPLFYELAGTTNNTAAGVFQTLDGSDRITAAAASSALNVSGFMNCDPSGGGSPPARRYLTRLKPNRSATVTINGVQTRILVSSVRSVPNQPTPAIPTQPELNPWNYVSSHPTNHPAAYDLWVDLFIGGRYHRVSN